MLSAYVVLSELFSLLVVKIFGDYWLSSEKLRRISLFFAKVERVRRVWKILTISKKTLHNSTQYDNSYAR
jgi:hypothetical protein